MKCNAGGREHRVDLLKNNMEKLHYMNFETHFLFEMFLIYQFSKPNYKSPVDSFII